MALGLTALASRNLAHAAGVETKNIQTSALTMGPEYSDEKIPKLLGYQSVADRRAYADGPFEVRRVDDRRAESWCKSSGWH